MRLGSDERLPRDKETGLAKHTCFEVYAELLVWICRWYPSLPDPRTLTMTEIRFFFEGIRADVRAATKPRDKKHAR